MARTGSNRPSLGKVVRRLSGARLCYGDPVRAGKRTVIPVARVRVAGGFGRGGGAGDDGSGGGGAVNAEPIGFLDVDEDGARFRPIIDPARLARGAVRTGLAAGALAVVAAQVAPRRRRFGAWRR